MSGFLGKNRRGNGVLIGAVSRGPQSFPVPAWLDKKADERDKDRGRGGTNL